MEHYYSKEPSQEPNVKDKICRLHFLWAPLLLGSTWQEKVSGIRSQMQAHSKAPTAVLLSALDETACECGFMDTNGAGVPPQASWALQHRAIPQTTMYPPAAKSSVAMTCGT